MTTSAPAHRCRICGATSYRAVIARDAQGALRPNGSYQCTGCSLQFIDPRSWWSAEVVDGAAPSAASSAVPPAVTPVSGAAGDAAAAAAAPQDAPR